MKKRKKQKANKFNNTLEVFVAERELDYHGLGILDSFDIEQILNNFIEDSYISKSKHVLIITGKGSVVKPLVERLLKQNKYVDSFKKAGYFNGQEGAFEVILKTV